MITVEEGNSSVEVKFQPMAPPSFFCSINDNKDKCNIKLSVSTVTDRYGDFCVSGKSSQLVIKPETDKKSCDIMITNENWKEEFEVPVKAKIDNLMDGDQMRKVEFSGKVESDFVDSDEHSFFTVEVHTRFLYQKLYILKKINKI